MSDDDSVLREQLQRLAGHYPNDEVAFANLQRRVRIAKRRRAVSVLTGLSAAVIITAGTVAFLNRGGTNRLETAHVGSNDPAFTTTTVPKAPDGTKVLTVDATEPATTAAPTTTTPPTTPPASTDVTDTASSATVPPSIVIPLGGADATSTPASTQQGGGASGAGTGTGGGSRGGNGGTPVTTPTNHPSPPTPPPTTTTTPPSTTDNTHPQPPINLAPKTFSGDGGSVTIRLQERGLVIVAQSLAPGFRLEVDRSEPYRLRIRLVSSDHVTRIEVRVQDGELTGAVDDSDSGGGGGGGFSGDPGGPPETTSS